jgi:DUF4097 and DUF4098 domain-containing protein YvlB
VIHKTFPVDGTPDIDVRIESGRVEVHRGSGHQVDVQVDTKMPGFIVEQRGNSILVSSDKDASWLSRGSAYVVIAAPERSDLRVSVASAPVNVDVDLGKVDIKTASGDIEIEKAESLVAKSASGDLHVGVVERSLRYTSASGDLRVGERAGGSVVASTASGDVDIEQSDATIDIKTASGDAYVRDFTGRSASFKAMSGTVDLGIRSGTDVSLDVNLLSGKLRVPDREPRRGPPERQMSIKAKMVSGDFNIERI